MTTPASESDQRSDDALMAAYAAGDAGAATILTERLLPLAWRVARRMLGDQGDAEDIAQDAMLRLWRIAPEWEPGRARVSTWVYRVTTNLCTDRLRRNREVAMGDEMPEQIDPSADAVAQLTTAARAAALNAALEDLPERQRQAVILRHLEGLANPEIAEIMDIGVEAVESLTARGKRQLTLALKGRKHALGYADD